LFIYLYTHRRGLVSPKASEVSLEQYMKISSYRPNAEKYDYTKVPITFAPVANKNVYIFEKFLRDFWSLIISLYTLL